LFKRQRVSIHYFYLLHDYTTRKISSKMPSAREWSTYIKIFSCLIIIGGVIGVISAFVGQGGIAFNWASFVLGIMYIAVGSRGFHAAVHHCAKDARQYYRGIISIIIFLIILNIIGIIVNQAVRADTYCRDYNDTHPDADLNCGTFKSALLVGGLVSLFIAVACCSACAFCARAYYHELIHEEQGYYTQVPNQAVVYQAVPTTANVYAQPPPVAYQQSPPAYQHV